MKNKIFSLFALSVFALVLLASGVSAALNLAPVSIPSAVSQGNTSVNVTFNVSNSGAIDYTALNWSGSSSNIGSWTILPTLTTITAGGVSTLSAVLTIPSSFSGDINAVIDLNNATTDEAQLSINIPFLPSEIVESNAIANKGGMEIKRIDFTNNGLSSGTSFGEDKSWFPFEKIDAEIQVKNTNSDERLNNIKVEWGLWDTKNHQWVIELNDENEFDLKHGDTKTMTVSFSIDNKMDVDLSDLSDGEHYKFYVIATGEADNDSSAVSVNDFETASVILENDFIILDKFQVPAIVQCGQKVTLTADVWNIGDNDQDQVSINVYNKELGINQNIEVGDINAFDRVSLNVDLAVPANAAEKTYSLQFTVYDEDKNIYQDDFNDDDSVFTVPMTVKGSCVYASASTTDVNVELSSGGRAGDSMTLVATIKNTGDKAVDYTFNLNGYASWAKLGDIAPANLTLAPGESQEVAVTLNVNQDASGKKTFNFETYSNGYLVTKQPLTATITSGFSLESITGNVVGSSATPLIIGLLSVILVVVIIIILVKVAKK